MSEKKWEMDSDRNEDPNREELLDDSFETWYKQISGTVFDSAVELGEDAVQNDGCDKKEKP